MINHYYFSNGKLDSIVTVEGEKTTYYYQEDNTTSVLNYSKPSFNARAFEYFKLYDLKGRKLKTIFNNSR